MARADRTYRLLIVEDDEADRRLYTRLLMRQAPGAFEITQVGVGAAGLAALGTGRHDCLLLDFNLPDMTGIEFLTEAASGGDLPCAVVLITGQGSEAIAVEAMKRGVQDYLAKDNLTPSSLWRAITTAVTQTELRQRLAHSLRELTAANAALEQEVLTRKAAEAELRAARDTAEEANRAKTRFVAMVTHELRTPLNGILGYAELLRVEGGLSARQDARVEAMLQAGKHLLEMIERVLDFAAIENGRLELHPVSVAVRDLCDRCSAFIGPIAAERALTLHMVSAHDAPQRIVTDPARLRQVLLNLLGNAVKYTHAGGVELRLLAGASPGGLRIEVADTGPGISEANRDRLFQDFERLSAATSVEGAGLGLAIAARIIGLMNGAIGHTARPGGGSVFWLELPTADPVPPPLEVVRANLPLIGRRVLLVDDIAMNRDVIGGFLRAGGHEAVLAKSGQEAVQLASEQEFDLILMDVRMPEMDGLEATRHIRALPPPLGQVPIIALTAYNFPDQIALCRDAGMDGHLAKPVDYAGLMHAIADTVARLKSQPVERSANPVPTPDNDGNRPPVGFDRALFDQTLAILPPGEISANLVQLRGRIEQMSQLLGRSTPPALLMQTAHELASVVGMFGFSALSAVSRGFECAVARDVQQAERLAGEVQSASRAAIATLDLLLHGDLA